MSSKGVVNLVSDEVKQIYSLLEADFTPLELCQRLAPLLESLENTNKQMSGKCELQCMCCCSVEWREVPSLYDMTSEEDAVSRCWAHN